MHIERPCAKTWIALKTKFLNLQEGGLMFFYRQGNIV